MQISIIKPGMLTTVQDLGRRAHLAEAVPVSGVMDSLSASIANIACGNSLYSAVLELTYADISFVADTDILIAYSGEGIFSAIDNELLPQGKALFIPKGAVITSTVNPKGCRTYLAIAGGWDVPLVMGSRSTCLVAGFGGFEGRALKKGDMLRSSAEVSDISTRIFKALKGNRIKHANWSIAREMFVPVDSKVIRVVPGPEFTRFTAISILDFLSTPYILTVDSNRMGYRLDGEQIISSNDDQLISTAVTPGTIQITGDGSPIMLMADCQTTGGYPRIAQVVAVDMPLCAQLKPGDEIFFSEISRHDAEMLYLERQEELKHLQTAVRSKYVQLANSIL